MVVMNEFATPATTFAKPYAKPFAIPSHDTWYDADTASPLHAIARASHSRAMHANEPVVEDGRVLGNEQT